MTDPAFRARLRGLARLALAEYDVDVRRLTLLPLATNAVFRVDTDAGPAALRLAAPGWRSIVDLRAEAMWTSALARDTSLTVPVPVPSRTGDLVMTIEADRGPTHACLTSWLPGPLLGRQLTPINLFRMGELFAMLHAHGREWSPPAGFSERRFDRVLSRDEPDAWRSLAEQHGATDGDIAVIADVHRRVDTAYAALDPSDLRVIHGDLHHDNIKVHAGALCPFDFEDTVWGYRIHDIAMAMLDLWDDTDPPTYDRLFDAFQRGYTATAQWPDGDLIVFQLGRYVWRLNWVARNQGDRLAGAVAATARTFDSALANGRLSK